MTKIKKIAVSTLAAAALMTSTLSSVASAYSDKGSWSLYSNPHASRTTQVINLNYYSRGYKAVITSKGYGGAYNSVTIFDEGTEKVRLSERETDSQIFKAEIRTDANGEHFASLTVKMSIEYVTENTAYNYGDIRLSNMA